MTERARKRERLVTACLLMLVLCSGIWSLWPKTISSGPLAVTRSTISVAIQGEVKEPGLKRLPWGARLQEAIKAAGGPTLDAAMELINLASPLDDGELVRVPSHWTAAQTPNAQPNTQNPDKKELATKRVNINRADQAELESLPGIGPALAKRMLSARPLNGFSDLDRIPGIGPRLLEQLKPLVTF